jgi:hypothetical protein
VTDGDDETDGDETNSELETDETEYPDWVMYGVDHDGGAE